MKLDQRYPCIDDLEAAALRRIPRFASEYLRSGIGREAGLALNRSALDAVQFDVNYLLPERANRPDTSVELLGRCYDLPFGVSPLGLSGLMWPKAVDILAASAAKANIPMGLSHHATTHLSDFKRIAGDNGWFQMYPPNDPEIRAQMLDEVAQAGFGTLVVTVDIPATTRRDRDLRVGLSVPPKFDVQTVLQVITHPQWALATALNGKPDFLNFRPYLPKGLSMADEAQFLLDLIEGHVTEGVLRDIRDRWKGKLVVKGIMTGCDAQKALDCGADAIWVSNHGARQLDAAPASVQVLPDIRKTLGPDVLVMVDSGPRTGLDIARMLASGADFVFLGRAFIYAVAALGARGGDHAVHILRQELTSTMGQIGARDVAALKGKLRQSR